MTSVTRPDGKWVPLVASIPHGGEFVPPEIAEKLLVDLDRNYADWYTAQLYSFLPSLGISTISTTAHRLVADANRDPANPVAPWPSGVIATTSTRHEPMYAEPISDLEIRDRLAIHSSYHSALDLILEEALARFDTIVLIDLHSFGKPLDVDVIIGDRHGASAGANEMKVIEESFQAHGFATRRNHPFSGGWIVRRFEGNPRIHAVIVEINQRLYLDPAEIDRFDWKRPLFDSKRLYEASNRIQSVLATMLDQLDKIKG